MIFHMIHRQIYSIHIVDHTHINSLLLKQTVPQPAKGTHITPTIYGAKNLLFGTKRMKQFSSKLNEIYIYTNIAYYTIILYGMTFVSAHTIPHCSVRSCSLSPFLFHSFALSLSRSVVLNTYIRPEQKCTRIVCESKWDGWNIVASKQAEPSKAI